MDLEKTHQLIGRARNGEREAFDELANEHGSRLEGVLRAQWKGSLREEEVADLLQETFLRAFGSLDRFEWQGPDSFFRWLSSIALNVAREEARREKRKGAAPLEEDVARDSVTRSKALRRDERFDRLQQAIDALPSDYREVLRLVRLEGMSVKDAAERMGRSPNAVSRLLLRASRKLRESFGETESLNLPDRRLRT